MSKQLNQAKKKEIKPKSDKLDKRDIFWYNDSTDEQELRSVIGFNDDRFVKNNKDCSDFEL